MCEIKGEKKRENLERDLKTFQDLISDFKLYLSKIEQNSYLIENGLVEQEKKKINTWIKEKEVIISILKRQLKDEFGIE